MRRIGEVGLVPTAAPTYPPTTTIGAYYDVPPASIAATPTGRITATPPITASFRGAVSAPSAGASLDQQA